MVYLKNVALVGASGTVGKFIASDLVKSNNHTVTAITRDAATPVPAGVKVTVVDYSDPSTIVAALKGIDILLITMSATAPPDTQNKLIEAAAQAGVKYVTANGWGPDASHPAAAETFLGPILDGAQKLVEKNGMGWITFVSGFWYEFSLAGTESRYGFDLKNRSVVFFDDGKTKINTSTWEQSARAVTAVLAQDEKTLEEKYRNKNVYFSSFYISQRDMFESVLRVTGTQESDWTIKYEPSAERYQKAMEQVKKGDRSAFGRALYSRWFYPEAGDAGSMAWEANHKLANEELGLPQEDLDERTKYAVENEDEIMGKYNRR
ncbi:hypothetical protein jhhlp_000614 [Lomentospora prolificans]|uniref:NAD(P)-binding domain-containing protein n=1 Tax=Lomentospora prolificans TaxID=41688 RepID=A0A2N3NJ04_9PEZI|nr:hypothetical protein jhhlp_000614 [Lomentospora prolificans]